MSGYNDVKNHSSLENDSFNEGTGQTYSRMNCIKEEDCCSVTEDIDLDNDNELSSKNIDNLGRSLICNQGFSFGGNVDNDKKSSFKYIPGTKFPPTSKNKSPTQYEHDDDDDDDYGSSLGQGGFNFVSSSLQPCPIILPSNSPRTSFRKGHRYKHSSVSMNFFQEPEFKIPLNIAKSLPIPDFSDLKLMIMWPLTYIQCFIIVLQLILCFCIFQFGQFNDWHNFTTLSHFILYDILGSISIIFVDLLSKFEVWGTGTITFPFGLNRIDILTSFAFAISLCFMGFDLIFHILEESIVSIMKSSHHSYFHEHVNDEIHSQGTLNFFHLNQLNHYDLNWRIWYGSLIICAILSILCLGFSFGSIMRLNSKFRIKTPIITLLYIGYLSYFPYITKFTHSADCLATLLIAFVIILYGLKVMKSTGSILLMGIENPNQVKETSTYISVKSKIYESITELPEFKSNCHLKYQNLIISKISLHMFIVIIILDISDCSDSDELNLRLSIDKCIKAILPNVETTIEIERT